MYRFLPSQLHSINTYLLLLIVLLSASLKAQVTVPAANTNTGSVNDPLGTYFGYERTAMIYTSAQIGATGSITAVGFYVNSVSTPGTATNVRIYMKQRTTLMTANTTYATEISGATLVYGPTNVTGFVANTWHTITLTTPFSYTGGTNNLEVIVETNATGTGNEGVTAKQFRYSSPGNGTSYQYWNADTNPPTAAGTRSTTRPNIQLTFAGSCNMPSAINASAITASSATIAWAAASPAPSSGYQWEVRSSGAAGSGATGLAASGSTAAGVVTANVTGLTANTTYSIYVRSNCGGSGFSGWTSAVTFFTGHCTASATNTSFEKISNISFNTINNNSTSTVGYEDFTGVNTTVSTGSPYTFTATISGGYSTDQILVWVDWNEDLDFVDAGEAVYTSAQGVGPHSTSITIPSGASAGNKRMRVRLHDVSTGANSTPCGTSTYGQVEDYTLVVVTAVPCSGTPVAGTAASNPTNLCSAGSVALSLTGYSTGVSGITFQWQSSPNNSTWINISGATTANYTVASVSAMIYFRCVVTCSNGGAFANSNSVQVTFGTPAGATFASPIAVGTLGCTAYASTLSNVTTNCYGNDLAVGTNQSSDDIFYQFVLSNANNFPTIVNMGHCGTTFDTYIHLLSSTGALIVENDDNGTVCGGTAGSLQQTLAVGTYHLVSEGYGAATGNIITTISIPAPTGTGTITGTSLTCASTIGLIYTVSGYTGATGYVWTVPSGATITAGQGTTSITVTMGASSGNVTCTPYNGACAGTVANYAITVNTLSTAPTSITGTTTICPGASTTLTTNGGTLGTDAENIWYSGACGIDAFTQEWAVNQPYSAPATTLNSQTGGVINVTSTSNDPMIEMTALGSFNPSTYKYINIRYRVTAGAAGTAEIFFYNASHNFAVGGESVGGALISDNTWRILSIDMTADPDYTTGGNIVGWRFDWATASGVTMDIDFISLSDQAIIGEGNTIVVSPSATTTYYTTKKGACNTTGCVSTSVTVNTLSVAPTNITGTTIICNGASTTLTVAGGTMGTGAVVEWFTGSCGGTSAGTGASITVSPTTTTTYYVRYAGTCNTTTCASVTVTVNPLPQVSSFASATGGTSICNGDIGQLIVTTNNGTGPFTVVYNNGTSNQTATGVVSGTAFNASPNPTSGTTTYTLVSVTDVNGCVRTSAFTDATASISVRQIPTATITGTLTVCQNAASPNITFTGTAPGGTNPPYTFTYNVNGSANQTVTTVSGSSVTVAVPTTATGTFTYNLVSIAYATNPACSNAATGSATVTVNPNHTLVLATGANIQTVCNGTAIANITYSVGGGATSASVTGLPTGVTGNFSAGTFTISGTPTVDGTFNYTVTTSGNACSTQSLNGTITVNSLIDWANLQFATTATICPSGSVTVYGRMYEPGVTPIAGAPANVVAQLGYSTSNTNPNTWTSWNTATYNVQVGNDDEFVATLSGLTAGTYYYAFRYSLNGCAYIYGGTGGVWSAGQSGVLTVEPNHTLVLATGTNTQTVCENVAIGAITYTLGGGATGATVTGLPTGVSGNVSGTTLTISGTPTIGGSYNYTIVTTGNACTIASLGGTITVNSLIDYANLQFPPTATICPSGNVTVYGQVYEPGVTPAAGVGAGLVAQIGYSTSNTNPNTWTNWSAATFNTQVGNNDEFMATLNGLPAGTYYYTFRYSLNGCSYQYGGYVSGFWNGTSNVSGVLTVEPNHTLSLTSGAATQSICQNTALSSITYTLGGGATGANVTGLPSGVTANVSGTTLTISGTASVSGSFAYSITTTGNSCTAATASGNISVVPTLSLTPSGTNVSCFGGSNGTASVAATGGTGTYTYSWYTGGSGNSISTLSANTYNVLVTSGVCSATTNYVVTQPTLLVANLSDKSDDLCQLNAGQVKLTVSGGVAPYNITWTPTHGSPASPQTISSSGGFLIVSGLQGNTTYSFISTDANGCVIP